MKRKVLVLLVLSLFVLSASLEERIESLLEKMTLEEKIALLSGEGFEVKGIKRLAIPALKMSDGPAGVRWGRATAFPAPISLAASWNPELVQEVGRAMGEELKAKGRAVLLAPCINIYRFPLGGRNFESYGEDPHLVGVMAEAFIKGVQSNGAITCVKHYVANNQEWNRGRLNVIVSERALREIYLPGFKRAVVDGGSLCVMAAYNKVNGHYCTANKHLLKEILKQNWGFEGFVVSDWGATHSTEKAALAGLDLEMPWGRYFGKKLLKAVKEGRVSRQEINDKVRRILRAMMKAGVYDNPPRKKDDRKVVLSHRELALKAALEGIVLLKNNGILPLDASRIKSIAIIGPNARYASAGGGGSAQVRPYYFITPLEGIRSFLPSDVKIYYSAGTNIRGDIIPIEDCSFSWEGKEGFAVSFFKNPDLKGRPVRTERRSQPWFSWVLHGAELENAFKNLRSCRWQGSFKAPSSGTYIFELMFAGGARLYLNGKLLIDEWEGRKRRRYYLQRAEVKLEKRKDYSLRIDYASRWGIWELKLGWVKPDSNLLERAVRLAAKADVAVVVAGLNHRFDTEGRDRLDMEIPNQNRLIEKVAQVNPNTVVVLMSGAALNISSWVDKVAAVLQVWYPGQETGRAIALTLFGKHNPSGKLPFSWLRSLSQCPAMKGYRSSDLQARYSEGVFVGYRWLESKGIKPLFPFGHGLSYTTFSYSDLKVERKGNEIHLSLSVRNTGSRPGAEVVQLYVSPPPSPVARPLKELKAFKKVFLQPGQVKRVELIVPLESLRYYDEEKGWVLQPGRYTFLVGSSSQDIRLKASLNI